MACLKPGGQMRTPRLSPPGLIFSWHPLFPTPRLPVVDLGKGPCLPYSHWRLRLVCISVAILTRCAIREAHGPS